uniref:Uncharacterized protein n=1 Tax=Prymnesium polylepis TaxID=72548 RepID=A0A7S4NLW7_9EUKA|mmetsp:Transcript_8852/g.21275  ORF Transcript_8852/g.21275 Transcript_8852/m.21275 type:complete len:136 (+) Transcript_8852:263-670(+)
MCAAITVPPRGVRPFSVLLHDGITESCVSCEGSPFARRVSSGKLSSGMATRALLPREGQSERTARSNLLPASGSATGAAESLPPDGSDGSVAAASDREACVRPGAPEAPRNLANGVAADVPRRERSEMDVWRADS